MTVLFPIREAGKVQVKNQVRNREGFWEVELLCFGQINCHGKEKILWQIKLKSVCVG